jgi:hypothetical protein
VTDDFAPGSLDVFAELRDGRRVKVLSITRKFSRTWQRWITASPDGELVDGWTILRFTARDGRTVDPHLNFVRQVEGSVSLSTADARALLPRIPGRISCWPSSTT